MCDDNFVDTKILRIGDKDVRLAYFPFMDHNPGPISAIFKLSLDALLYLSQDDDRVIAIHCKAGKGRTGLAICAYLIFSQACESFLRAVQLFNKRRTKNGRGLQIPSQIRYLNYFEHFLKHNFKQPFSAMIAPYPY